jgi:hypothetical protein
LVRARYRTEPCETYSDFTAHLFISIQKQLRIRVKEEESPAKITTAPKLRVVLEAQPKTNLVAYLAALMNPHKAADLVKESLIKRGLRPAI